MAVNREHIIAEIKRTAELNGGEPLGVRRFFQETGIKVSDWDGKFWVRWGDALYDSGYSPNSFNKAYKNEFVVGKLVDSIRDLGHYPVNREIKMLGRDDSDFPSLGVFSRIGKKTKLIQMVIDYCQIHPGYDDVIAICEPLIVESDFATEVVSSDDVEFGFVYLMKSGKYYKIGYTNAVGRREYELAIQLPDKLTTVHVIKTDDPSGIEAYWHKRFQDKRKNGEWFDLLAEDIKAFKRRIFM